MRKLYDICLLFVAALAAGCASGVKGTPASSNPAPSPPASSGTIDCDGQWMWGGNYQALTSSSASMFLPAGALNNPRAGHTATLLKDGTVLVVGGGQLDVDDLLVSISVAEVFDPLHSQATVLKSCAPPIEFQAATLLNSGKVLITGGNEFLGYPTWLAATSKGQLYDPVTRTFVSTPPMSISRTHHTSTLLADGRVLITGGSTTVGSATNSVSSSSATAEIYDPSTNSFSAAAKMITARTTHTATLLPTGQVLIAGGENSEGALASAELYDPQTNTFSATGTMCARRTGHTATLLPSGKVLLSGGAPLSATVAGGVVITASPQSTTELYDPGLGTFSPAASMATGRLAHSANLLSDGRVLIAGGFKGYAGRYESFDSAEIYNPSSDSFITVTPMNAGRFWHSATTLPGGSVLILGGINEDAPQASAEVFEGAK